MSMLEKTISLLEVLPDHKVEAAYAFIRLMDTSEFKNLTEPISSKDEAIQAMFGMAHEYANPELIDQEEGAFERAMVEKHAADKYTC